MTKLRPQLDVNYHIPNMLQTSQLYEDLLGKDNTEFHCSLRRGGVDKVGSSGRLLISDSDLICKPIA